MARVKSTQVLYVTVDKFKIQTKYTFDVIYLGPCHFCFGVMPSDGELCHNDQRHQSFLSAGNTTLIGAFKSKATYDVGSNRNMV